MAEESRWRTTLADCVDAAIEHARADYAEKFRPRRTREEVETQVIRRTEVQFTLSVAGNNLMFVTLKANTRDDEAVYGYRLTRDAGGYYTLHHVV